MLNAVDFGAQSKALVSRHIEMQGFLRLDRAQSGLTNGKGSSCFKLRSRVSYADKQ